MKKIKPESGSAEEGYCKGYEGGDATQDSVFNHETPTETS